jgi:hypothetical protein
MKFNLSAGLWLNFKMARSPKSFWNRAASRSLSPLNKRQFKFAAELRNQLRHFRPQRIFQSANAAQISVNRHADRAAEFPGRSFRASPGAAAFCQPRARAEQNFVPGDFAFDAATRRFLEIRAPAAPERQRFGNAHGIGMRRVPRERTDPVRFFRRQFRTRFRTLKPALPQNSTPRASAQVSVPVLSKTMVSTPAMRSMTSAFFKKIFSRASSRCAVPCVSGAASASAHGQATIKTDVKAFKAFVAS